MEGGHLIFSEVRGMKYGFGLGEGQILVITHVINFALNFQLIGQNQVLYFSPIQKCATVNPTPDYAIFRKLYVV